MDEAARTSGQAVDEPKRGPKEIRADIEQTREELGETVEALAAKTDVKGQAKAKVEETKERARATVETVKDRVGAAKTTDIADAARAKADAVKERVTGEAADIAGAARAKADAVKERVTGEAADIAGAARAKADAVKERVAANGGSPGASSGPATVARRDTARRLRSHPEIFGLIAAFAAGMLVRSLAGS